MLGKISHDVVMSEVWETTMAGLMARIDQRTSKGKGSVVMVCGAKGMGKSSFLRTLVARVLEADDVERRLDPVFLETDLGQPEYSVPGLVGLRSLRREDYLKRKDDVVGRKRKRKDPHFFDHSLFIGDNTPKYHPVLYMDSIKELLGRYEKMKSASNDQVPILFINTHGWVSGMGANMVNAIATHAEVNLIVHIWDLTKPDGLSLGDCKSVDKIFTVGPVTTLSATNMKHPTPKFVRFQLFALYFKAHSLSSLLSKPKLRVNISQLENVIASLDGAEMNEQQKLEAIEYGLVGLCHNRKNSPFFDFAGLGFVQHVDLDTGDIYIVTPLSSASVKEFQVNTIMLGTLQAPLELWEQRNSEAVHGTCMQPYFAYDHHVLKLIAPAALCDKEKPKKSKS